MKIAFHGESINAIDYKENLAGHIVTPTEHNIREWKEFRFTTAYQVGDHHLINGEYRDPENMRDKAPLYLTVTYDHRGRSGYFGQEGYITTIDPLTNKTETSSAGKFEVVA